MFANAFSVSTVKGVEMFSILTESLERLAGTELKKKMKRIFFCFISFFISMPNLIRIKEETMAVMNKSALADGHRGCRHPDRQYPELWDEIFIVWHDGGGEMWLLSEMKDEVSVGQVF